MNYVVEEIIVFVWMILWPISIFNRIMEILHRIVPIIVLLLILKISIKIKTTQPTTTIKQNNNPNRPSFIIIISHILILFLIHIIVGNILPYLLMHKILL